MSADNNCLFSIYLVNQKVAQALVQECTKLYVEKEWSPDSVARLPFLPRTCELRKVDGVPEWVESKFILFQATNAGRSRRRTRQSTLHDENQQSSDSDSESADGDSVECVFADEASTSRAALKPSKSSAKRRSRKPSTDDDEDLPITKVVKFCKFCQ
jgi:hypothetical protein